MNLIYCFRNIFKTLCLFTLFLFTLHSNEWPNQNVDSSEANFPSYSTFNNSGLELPKKTTFPGSTNIVIWLHSHRLPRMMTRARVNALVKMMNQDGKKLCSGAENATSWKTSSDNSQHSCRFSVSGTSIRGADAVVFLMFLRGFRSSGLPSLLERTPKQLWVMYNMEPPPYSRWKEHFGNLMNWTISYRTESTIVEPYGQKIISQVPQNETVFIGSSTLTEWIAGKSKLVVGVISKCHTSSQREHLISRMMETGLGQIDIFGRCGYPANICGRNSPNCSKFWRELSKKYKFYLAFENSFCKDYITEKFWRTLENGMVPVVYGGGNYELEAPPNSYINVMDFNSADELMKHLKELDVDNGKYASYFEWRRNYKVSEDSTSTWCKLCESVREHKTGSRQVTDQTYPDLKLWWEHDPQKSKPVCKSALSKMIPWVQDL